MNWKLPIKCTHANFFMFTLSDIVIPIVGMAMYHFADKSIICVHLDGEEYELSKLNFFSEFEKVVSGHGEILPPNYITEFHWIGDNVLNLPTKVYNNNE